jgi:hypothetical protein
MVRPSQRREMARSAIEGGHTTIRHACQTLVLSGTCFRYQHKASEENARIADWLIRLTTPFKEWGFGLCFLHLRNVKGFGWNHKWIYLIYRELELNLRIKPIVREKPEPLAVPETINQVWSMRRPPISRNLIVKSGPEIRSLQRTNESTYPAWPRHPVVSPDNLRVQAGRGTQRREATSPVQHKSHPHPVRRSSRSHH